MPQFTSQYMMINGIKGLEKSRNTPTTISPFSDDVIN